MLIQLHLPLAVDITSDDSVKESIKYSIRHFGQLYVKVNNAGYSLVGSLGEVEGKEFRETMDVNLFSTVNLIRAVMPYFRKQASGHLLIFHQMQVR